MKSLFDLTGRTALVTGARGGIGLAVAEALADAGASVVAHVHRPAADHALPTWVYDLSEPAGIAAAVRDLPPIDILVNNAGIIHREPALTHGYDQWRAVLTVNLDAVFALTQAVAAGMIGRGHGKVVNIASLLSFQGGITVPGYTASKHAVAGLTKALANEWAAHNVQVNAIAPGYIATANTAALRADPRREQAIRERIPAGRWGRPDDLAGAAVFLSSPASDYVTGHVLAVDGGWLAR